MSRNLCRTDCDYCQSRVEPLEPPRLATEADVGRYTEQFAGRLWCAAAECVACGAEYLAWYNHCPWPREPTVPRCEDEHIDLSFRSTFNDEPGEADKPKWVVEHRAVRIAPYTGDQWDYPAPPRRVVG